MTIDEAVELVNIEKECIKRADNCNRNCNECDLLQDTNDLLDLYKHIPEWLEELKALRENSNGYSKEDIMLNRKVMYNKAIDDFAKMAQGIKYQDGELSDIDLEYIAGKLKAGGENED